PSLIVRVYTSNEFIHSSRPAVSRKTKETIECGIRYSGAGTNIPTVRTCARRGQCRAQAFFGSPCRLLSPATLSEQASHFQIGPDACEKLPPAEWLDEV